MLHEPLLRIKNIISDLFEILDNADLLYTGLSTWAMTDAEAGSPGTVCCSAVDDFPDLVRMKNMLYSSYHIFHSKCFFETEQSFCAMFSTTKEKHLQVYKICISCIYEIVKRFEE